VRGEGQSVAARIASPVHLGAARDALLASAFEGSSSIPSVSVEHAESAAYAEEP